MEIFFQRGRKTYYRHAITDPTDVRPALDGRAYPCLVWDHVGTFSDDERSRVARSLIVSNCRYVVAAGRLCERWHDATDWAWIKEYRDESEAIRDERHVMTSWHDDESVDDVTFFFALTTPFDDHDFTDLLVLHVGGTAIEQEVIEEGVRRAELGEAAV